MKGSSISCAFMMVTLKFVWVVRFCSHSWKYYIFLVYLLSETLKLIQHVSSLENQSSDEIDCHTILHKTNMNIKFVLGTQLAKRERDRAHRDSEYVQCVHCVSCIWRFNICSSFSHARNIWVHYEFGCEWIIFDLHVMQIKIEFKMKNTLSMVYCLSHIKFEMGFHWAITFWTIPIWNCMLHRIAADHCISTYLFRCLNWHNQKCSELGIRFARQAFV